MQTRQYCHFAVKSATLSAAEMAARLGMEPDEALVKGSRSAEHVLPRCHSWKIVRRSEESVDEQICHLVRRLTPIRAELITLCADAQTSPVMQVVRYFHDPDGVRAAPGDTPWEQARHWPRPLGWHLPTTVIDFLSATRTELDVDEYDLGDDHP